jgi:hypothetical protein
MTSPTKDNFQTGVTVSTTGIYRVIHAEHRLPPEVILIGGAQFPRCSKCSNPVMFSLVMAARAGFEWQPVTVYELPVLDDEAEATSA